MIDGDFLQRSCVQLDQIDQGGIYAYRRLAYKRLLLLEGRLCFFLRVMLGAVNFDVVPASNVVNDINHLSLFA